MINVTVHLNLGKAIPMLKILIKVIKMMTKKMKGDILIRLAPMICNIPLTTMGYLKVAGCKS
jgi:hypothetical protein